MRKEKTRKYFGIARGRLFFPPRAWVIIENTERWTAFSVNNDLSPLTIILANFLAIILGFASGARHVQVSCNLPLVAVDSVPQTKGV